MSAWVLLPAAATIVALLVIAERLLRRAHRAENAVVAQRLVITDLWADNDRLRRKVAKLTVEPSPVEYARVRPTESWWQG